MWSSYSTRASGNGSHLDLITEQTNVSNEFILKVQGTRFAVSPHFETSGRSTEMGGLVRSPNREKDQFDVDD